MPIDRIRAGADLRRELERHAGTMDIVRLDAPSFPRKRESMETT